MSVRQEEGGRRRKTYALTEEGRAALAAWADDATWTPPQLRDEGILKVFAGGDPFALFEPRRSWHREKLAELEGYLEEVRGEESWRGSELALIAGIAYHRKMLEMLDELEPLGSSGPLCSVRARAQGEQHEVVAQPPAAARDRVLAQALGHLAQLEVGKGVGELASASAPRASPAARPRTSRRWRGPGSRRRANTKIFTLVWARRFAGYKRAGLITTDEERFEKLLASKKYPIQIIWAGKPYPVDYPAITEFNNLVHLSRKYKNVSVVIGYELMLSRRLKQGADCWLNNPRVPREASGTSGMTAAMNGAINFSTDDGWIPEFMKDGENGFVVPKVDYTNMTVHDQDSYDLNCIYEILESKILPMYYDEHDKWRQINQNGMKDVRVQFDSNRMAREYYELLYNS